MPTRPTTIWCNLRLDGPARAQLEAGTAGHALVWAAAPGPNNPSGTPDPVLARQPVEVVFGQFYLAVVVAQIVSMRIAQAVKSLGK